MVYYKLAIVLNMQAIEISISTVNYLCFPHNIVLPLFSDIQQCYEVTLQLNATENGKKENGPKETLEVKFFREDKDNQKVLNTEKQIQYSEYRYQV